MSREYDNERCSITQKTEERYMIIQKGREIEADTRNELHRRPCGLCVVGTTKDGQVDSEHSPNARAHTQRGRIFRF